MTTLTATRTATPATAAPRVRAWRTQYVNTVRHAVYGRALQAGMPTAAATAAADRIGRSTDRAMIALGQHADAPAIDTAPRDVSPFLVKLLREVARPGLDAPTRVTIWAMLVSHDTARVSAEAEEWIFKAAAFAEYMATVSLCVERGVTDRRRVDAVREIAQDMLINSLSAVGLG